MFLLYKSCKNVSPLIFVENVPEELREPFYTDQYDQEHIKPPVVGLLLSAELYCRAGSLILRSDAAKPLLGHDAVIQALAQKGLYVTDQEKLVTERDLHKKPIPMVRLPRPCRRHVPCVRLRVKCVTRQRDLGFTVALPSLPGV